MKTLFLILSILGAQPVVMRTNPVSTYWGGSGIPTGQIAFRVCTQVGDDTSPSLGGVSPYTDGCNILLTSDAHSGANSISIFDDFLSGTDTIGDYETIFWIIGTPATNQTTISDGGNFRLKTIAWDSPTTGDHSVLQLKTVYMTGAITVFADAGGGQVTVTSAAHGLQENQTVTISGTTNYNGTFTATNVLTNTFEITDTWVADDATGTWIGYRFDEMWRSGNVDDFFYQNVYISYGNAADFPAAQVVIGQADSGATSTNKIAVVGEGVADGSLEGHGANLYGKTSSAQNGVGASLIGKVNATGDTTTAFGSRSISTDTHASGSNVGAYCNAANGLTNYCTQMAAGDIDSSANALDWDLYDNQGSALSLDSTGADGILAISTLDGEETVAHASKATITSALDAATGDEIALNISYTTNKATSGDDYGLKIRQTDTASPATSYLIDAGVGANSQFNVTNTGIMTLYGSSWTDLFQIFHDESNTYFKTTDGNFIFQTDEGTNTPTVIELKPKGSSEISSIGFYDTNTQNLYLYTAANRAYIESQNGALGIQAAQVQDVKVWESIASGNPYFYIYGWDGGTSAVQYVRLSVDATGDALLETDSGDFIVDASSGVSRFSDEDIYDVGIIDVDSVRADAASTTKIDFDAAAITVDFAGATDYTFAPNTFTAHAGSDIYYEDDVKTYWGTSLDAHAEWDTVPVTDIMTFHTSASGFKFEIVGATTTEDLVCTADSNIAYWNSGSGVTQVDYGTIDLATDALDLSEGNITNVGDIQLDSITADATSGGIQIGGTGATSNESFLMKFGETANQIDVTTTTGATDINYTGIDINTTTEVSAENLVSTDDASITDDLDVGGDVNVAGSVIMDGSTRNIYSAAAASDVAAIPLQYKGADSYSVATGTNRNSSDFWFCPSNPTEFFTVLDIGSGVCTVSINTKNVDYTFISGTNFLYGASTSEAATNLAYAINNTATLKDLVVATANANVVNLAPQVGSCGLSIGTDGNTKISATIGTGNKYWFGGNEVRAASTDLRGAMALGFTGNIATLYGDNGSTYGNFTGGMITSTVTSSTIITGAAIGFSNGLASLSTQRSSAGADNINLYFAGNATGEYLGIGTSVTTAASGNLSSVVFATDLDGTPEIKHYINLDGTLMSTGVGPHTFGASAEYDYTQFRITGNFTSGGADQHAEKVLIEGNLTGASGDTQQLTGVYLTPNITTQGAAEAITTVASMYIVEPTITIGTATITDAATVYIKDAPTEGTTRNAALLVDAGLAIFDGGVTSNTDVVIDNTGASVNSPYLYLRGDNSSNAVESRLYTAYGAQPYLIIGVSDDGTTPSTVDVLHIDDNSIRPASAGAIDAGSTTAYFNEVYSENLLVITSKGAKSTDTISTESVTFQSGGGDASKVTAGGLIPGGVFLLGITSRVTTTGTTCTSYTVGDGMDADLYGVSTDVTEGTVTLPASGTANWSNPQHGGPFEVTITAVGGNCVDMVVAISAHFITFGAATSN